MSKQAVKPKKEKKAATWGPCQVCQGKASLMVAGPLVCGPRVVLFACYDHEEEVRTAVSSTR